MMRILESDEGRAVVGFREGSEGTGEKVAEMACRCSAMPSITVSQGGGWSYESEVESVFNLSHYRVHHLRDE